MKRRWTLTLISTAFVWLWIAFPVSNAVAQSAADVEGVKEASKTFYAALAVLDNGEAMEKIWAHTALRHIRRKAIPQLRTCPVDPPG